MSSAPKYKPHYTHEDYSLWKGDWELWEGCAVAMSPSPFGIHQRILFSLAAELRFALRSVQCDATALGELDWIVSNDTVVRPDVMVVCGDPPKQHLHEVPAFIAEVLSDSTRQNDLTFKRELYHLQGVQVYLIIDPEAETCELDRKQVDGRYETERPLGSFAMRLCEDCTITIDLAAVFRR